MKHSARLAVLIHFLSAAVPIPAVAAVDVTAAERVKPALPNIPNRVFSLVDYGAIGDGKAMNTAAFKRAIAAVAQAGGGKLILPAGVVLTGPFALCSNLERHLVAGALIKAPESFAAQGLPSLSQFKTQAEASAAVKAPDSLISGKNLRDVAPTGPGTIDGSGRHWWERSERAMRNAAAKKMSGRIVSRGHTSWSSTIANGCWLLTLRFRTPPSFTWCRNGSPI